MAKKLKANMFVYSANDLISGNAYFIQNKKAGSGIFYLLEEL